MEQTIHIARFHVAAVSGREDQLGLAPLRAGREALFELSFAVRPKMVTSGAGIGSTATEGVSVAEQTYQACCR